MRQKRPTDDIIARTETRSLGNIGSEEYQHTEASPSDSSQPMVAVCATPSRAADRSDVSRGFPESWYYWRHQITALAEAGFRAVAPDRCFRRSEMYPPRRRDDLFDDLRGRPLQEAGVLGLRCLDRLALQDVNAWNPA